MSDSEYEDTEVKELMNIAKIGGVETWFHPFKDYFKLIWEGVTPKFAEEMMSIGLVNRSEHIQIKREKYYIHASPVWTATINTNYINMSKLRELAANLLAKKDSVDESQGHSSPPSGRTR